MKQILQLSIFCYAMAFSLSAAPGPNPGIVVAVSQSGIDLLSSSFVSFLNAQGSNTWNFPDTTGSIDITLGQIDYSLTNLISWNVGLDQLKVGIDQDTGATISITNALVSIEGQFEYNYTIWFIPIWSSGVFNVTTSGISIDVQAAVGITPDGAPTIQLTDCSASVGDAAVEFQVDGFNPFITLFSEHFKEEMESFLSDEPCKALQSTLDNLFNTIGNSLNVCIGPCLDLHLVNAPVFGKDFIQTSHVGEVTWGNSGTHAPFPAPRLFQRMPTPSSMLTLYVSTYVFNTLFFAAYENNILNFTVTKNFLTYTYRYALDTTCSPVNACISSVLPGLDTKYPNASVEVEMVATTYPSSTISNNISSVNIKADWMFAVRKSDGSLKNLGRLSFSSSSEVNVSVAAPGTGRSFFSNIYRFVLAVNTVNLLKATSSGLPSGTDLSALFNFVVSRCLLPFVNELGSSGLPIIRVGGIQYANASLNMIENAFVFTADAVNQ